MFTSTIVGEKSRDQRMREVWRERNRRRRRHERCGRERERKKSVGGGREREREVIFFLKKK
jgi:hypothetical protein